MNALGVVQRQVEAYNARNLEAFAACFAENVMLYRPPTIEPAIVGLAALRRYYATERFNRPALRAEILHRIVLGERVIDHERISGVQPEPFEVTVVYDVRNDRIVRAWLFGALPPY